ncbi:MAG: hypothetical protein CMG62_11610 [Candidatus Marinimicrobia bacterium]|nr:hypothetical protein [Candidatus Neomarinimicrobiota bacterium]|tara:strand:+ start:2561 stop:3127 length:567 start_codon:yes stop_codon:yes gene_type:complete
MYFNIFQRIFDLFIIFLFSPIILILFILIFFILFFVNSGSILFYQYRVGKNNIKFKIIKFKTLKKDIYGKQYITKFGKFLRRTSLDELPQIINIINNEMSIVGPRPLPPKNYIEIFKDIFDKRSLVLPGLTGYSQINYKGKDRTLEEKLKLDLYFVNNKSIKLYFYIILITFKVIIIRFFRNTSGKTL